MRRFGFVALLVALAVPSLAEAQMPLASAGRFGLGFGSGSWSSGIAGKYYLSEGMSVQGVVGTGWWGLGLGLAANVDVLWEQKPLVEIEPGALNWYFGLGGNLVLANGIGAGPSAIIGLGWQFKQFPVEITGEYRPTLMLGNAFGNPFSLGWGGGSIRYFF